MLNRMSGTNVGLLFCPWQFQCGAGLVWFGVGQAEVLAWNGHADYVTAGVHCVGANWHEVAQRMAFCPASGWNRVPSAVAVTAMRECSRWCACVATAFSLSRTVCALRLVFSCAKGFWHCDGGVS